jgi:predicted RNA-binding protein with RPS1 domain
MIQTLVVLSLLVSSCNGFRVASIRKSPMPNGLFMTLSDTGDAPVETDSEKSTVDVPDVSTVVKPVAESDSEVPEVAAVAEGLKDAGEEEAPTGFAAISVGQEYQGKVISAKQFGVFVDIGEGQNALIPRSVLTRGGYERLKGMTSTEKKIDVEIIGVNAENQTISAKYIPPGHQERADISALQGQDLSSKFYTATVVSTHNFGVFAELDDFGVEGLIPSSKLPSPLPKESIEASYKAGQQIQVKIEQLAIADKKLVLSADCDPNEKNPMSDVPHTKWFQGIVQNVASFGLFVRPAGYDDVGLVHYSRIPRGLSNILKKKIIIDSSKNQTDVEALFTPGDVIKCRVHAAETGSRKIELSMLPYRTQDDDNDDYIVEGRDAEDTKERNPRQNNKRRSDDPYVNFDPEDTLLWWRGATYEKSPTVSAIDDEIDVVNESSDIVEGTWRRMFEVDMREDQADFTSKIFEMEMKELADEIGELDGLDDDLLEDIGLQCTSIGSYISKRTLPIDWENDIDFYKNLEKSESLRLKTLRGGKVSEQDEFEKLLIEVEQELKAAASSKKSIKKEDEVLNIEYHDTDEVLDDDNDVAGAVADSDSVSPIAESESQSQSQSATATATADM